MSKLQVAPASLILSMATSSAIPTDYSENSTAANPEVTNKKIRKMVENILQKVSPKSCPLDWDIVEKFSALLLIFVVGMAVVVCLTRVAGGLKKPAQRQMEKQKEKEAGHTKGHKKTSTKHLEAASDEESIEEIKTRKTKVEKFEKKSSKNQ